MDRDSGDISLMNLEEKLCSTTRSMAQASEGLSAILQALLPWIMPLEVLKTRLSKALTLPPLMTPSPRPQLTAS